MNQAVQNVIKEMVAVFERTGDAFAFDSINHEKVPCDDYGDKLIPDERVRRDWDEVTELLNRFYRMCGESGSMADFCFAFAAYGNFFIRKGFYLRLGMDGFERRGEWFGAGQEYGECLRCLWRGIRDQEYIWFERALGLKSDAAVASMYLFVRHAAEFSRNITAGGIPDEKQEEAMWECYESLPADYQEYVLGQGDAHQETFNLAADENWLPYINFSSVKEYLISYILTFYRGIMEALELDSRNMDNAGVYAALSRKFQIPQLIDFAVSRAPQIKPMLARDFKTVLTQLCDFTAELMRMIGAAAPAYKQTEMYFTVFFEKLNALDSLDSQPGEAGWGSFCEPMALPGRQDPPALRNMYLNIPVVLSEQITARFFLSRYDIFKKNRQLEQQLAENQRLSREKQDMMDHYAHSWKHISYPMTVKRVAEELSRTNLPLANRLFKAYNSERTLQGGLQILQYSISDQPDAMREAFRQGFYCVGAQVGKSIRQVMEESVDLVLFKVLMEEADGSRRISRCRSNLQKRYSLEALRERYTRCYILGEGRQESVLDWFDANVFPLEISVDALWQEIRVKEDEFSDFQLSELFVELFTNVLTHGTDWCRVSLESGEQSMDVSVTNALGEENHGTCLGLKTLGTIVDKINWGTKVVGITSGISADNVYGVKIAFDRKVMYRRGRR
ncbi:MAG: hypothetical protein KH230_03520 [Enterocloster asparagiformis]|nr:hypothetical protein [Enterocloster asparagiformis]